MSQKTSIDWLKFRTQADVRDGLEAVRALYGANSPDVRLADFRSGRAGWQQTASVCLADMALGWVEFGGESQRGWVSWSLSGRGCQFVRDWDALDSVERLPDAELRRVDVALTTWRGEVSHQRVVTAHQDGRFVTRGRPPELRQFISSDPRAGRTCEIGNRKGADKFARCYEKGFEMASKLPVQMRDECTHIEGFPVEGIYRCEAELKSVTRPIPWEVVERRDQYFAGCYPFFADLLPGVEADILQRRPERGPITDLMVQLAHARVQYGRTLFTALHAFHGDIGAVWERIVGDQHNEALLQAGVLLVDHDADVPITFAGSSRVQ